MASRNRAGSVRAAGGRHPCPGSASAAHRATAPMPTVLPKSAARWSMSSPTSGRSRHSPRTRASAGGFAQLLHTETTAHRDSLMYIERMRVLHDLGLWLMAGALLIWSLVSVGPGKDQPRRCDFDCGGSLSHPPRLARSRICGGQRDPVRLANCRCDPGDRRGPQGGRRPGCAAAGAAGRQHRLRECRLFLSLRAARCFAASACGSNGVSMSVWSVHPAPASRP